MAGSRKSAKGAKESRAFADLKAMPCFDEFDDRVKAGIALEEVARWLQEDMFQQPNIKRDSLVRKLFRYKASLPPAELVKEPPPYVKKAIEKMRRGVNEIEELEALYLLQLQRISLDAETETRINKLFNGTGSEIRLAMDLLVRRLQLKQELGLVTKSPTEVQFSGQVGISNLVDEDTDEQTKAKLGMLAGKVLQMMSRTMASKPSEDSESSENMQEAVSG